MIQYTCASCGKSIETDEIMYRCPDCSRGQGPDTFQKGNLLVTLDTDSAIKTIRGKKVDPHALFPYDVSCCSSYPAGNTPLIRQERLNTILGIKNLYYKIESTNPSGSYKDRASLLVAAQARHHSVDTVVLASTGNAGSAMSCAGAALGLNIILFVPASAPKEKLAQSVFYGASVIPVDGTYDDAFLLSIEYSKQFGGINRNTGYNPMTIEGKKSAALEIINQLNGTVPDAVYIPVGDGVIYSGMCKGFEDLRTLGIISSMPRCIAVQAEGSAAIYESFTKSAEVLLDTAETLADSISVCSPACGEVALQYLEKTDGWALTVTDSEIISAQTELAGNGGIFVEPSSAAAYAGIKKDIAEGKIQKDDTAVLLLTGTGFKDMGAVYRNIRIPDPVQCNLDAVIEYLTTEFQIC